MDTPEHTALGNSLRFADWEDSLHGNPYINFDSKGTMKLALQALDKDNIPIPLDLTLSAGEMIAMSGDYFGGKEVDLELPSLAQFHDKKHRGDTDVACEHLGEYLIQKTITDAESVKFINSYKRLANPGTKRAEIDLIYKINNAQYIPFSQTLNAYAQQLAFALRVKNYGEILNRNMSHFTPWSVRAYVIGHSLALRYARVYYEITQFIQYEQRRQFYLSDNDDFLDILDYLNTMSHDGLKNLAHRYQVLALSMELFTFHYYSDHYAAGHGSLVGDLRMLLPQRYGYLGGLLVNSLHDELNAVTVYTRRPYDPTPDRTDPPLEAGGDGDFDSPRNYFNKQACLSGMRDSLNDIHRVFKGTDVPNQAQYGGLDRMPDIDENYRQPQPLLLLGKDNRIYYRTNLKAINLLAPSQLKAAYQNPLHHGYTELTSTWSTFILVFKLRVLSYWYGGELQAPSKEHLLAIEEEEGALNPGRQPIPLVTRSIPTTEPEQPLPQWQQPAHASIVTQGLHANSFLKAPVRKAIDDVVYEKELSLS